MNNSVFGKTVENIRKVQNVKLINCRKEALELSSKPNFDGAEIFDKNLIAVHTKKTEVYFNKPIYESEEWSSQWIFQFKQIYKIISHHFILHLFHIKPIYVGQTLMFDFHYNYIREKYGNKAELLFTDTDSMIYCIQTDDFCKDVSKDLKRKFDKSDYPDNHPSGIKKGINKKVIAKFKDEAAWKQITHFVGLRAKLYSYKLEDKEELKCKSIKKNVIRNTLSFDDYKKFCFQEKTKWGGWIS